MNIAWLSCSVNKFQYPILFWSYEVSWFLNSCGYLFIIETNFLKQILYIIFGNNFRSHKCSFLFFHLFGLAFFSVKFCCKKAWWYKSDYTPSNTIIIFVKKSIRKKDQSIFRKHGGFRTVFKLTRNLFLFLLDIIKVYDEKVTSFCFVFLNVTYINSHPVNPFSGKFLSSRRKPSYQYYLICN